jgi:SAM-dependent methyltransferase
MGALHRLHFRGVHGHRIAHLADALTSALPDDVATLLDVGSGDGLLASELVRRRPELRVTGVDVVPRREAFIPVELFDGRTLPFDDGAFDAVLFVDVLHHASDQGALLREASRVAPRHVVVKDHLQRHAFDRLQLRAMDWVGNRHNDVPLPYDYWSADRWRAEIALAGLVLDRFDDRVRVYPGVANAVLGRGLHVLWLAHAA